MLKLPVKIWDMIFNIRRNLIINDKHKKWVKIHYEIKQNVELFEQNEKKIQHPIIYNEFKKKWTHQLINWPSYFQTLRFELDWSSSPYQVPALMWKAILVDKINSNIKNFENNSNHNNILRCYSMCYGWRKEKQGNRNIKIRSVIFKKS